MIELNTCKAELGDMTDEVNASRCSFAKMFTTLVTQSYAQVFELQTLLEAAKRQALDAESRPFATPPGLLHDQVKMQHPSARLLLFCLCSRQGTTFLRSSART